MKEKARDLTVRDVHRVPTELRHTPALRWCCAGDVNSGYCRQLPHLGESRGAGRHRKSRPELHTQATNITQAFPGDKQFGVQSRKCGAVDESSTPEGGP